MGETVIDSKMNGEYYYMNFLKFFNGKTWNV